MLKVRALDTQILCWGVQGKSKPEDIDKIPVAQELIAELIRKKDSIVVPSVALGEFLIGYEPNAHFEILQTFQKRFKVLAYDAKAAVHAARIYQGIHPEVLKKMKAEIPELTHGMIRADCEILATLLANDVDFIYSHDKGMQRIGRKYMHVEEMPLKLALSNDDNSEDDE